MTEPAPGAFAIVDLPEQPFVGVTKTVTMTTIPEIADEIPGLIDWVLNHGYAPPNAPFLRYLVIDMAREFVIQAGVPVPSPVETDGDLESGVLPSGRYATTTHVGHPDELERVTGRFLQWANGEGLHFDVRRSDQGDVWASRIEWYETNPVEQPDMSQWVTRLTFKLTD
ncbi:MAG TPA: GyrI-like domain-containing protein [Pseudolysinimonas sp.]|nr:GyrI-like domain-containing protein [Pseudolysinimonas sp.]